MHIGWITSMKLAIPLGLLLVTCAGAESAGSAFKALRLYHGKWQVSMNAAAPGAKPADLLQNDCAPIGQYFGCQQTVNGKVTALVLFIPREKAGSFYTQSVTAEGEAGGRGELEIEGDHWTFMGKGKDKMYRTTNVFTGKDRIHFEQAESVDGKDWKVTGSGDEKRY